MQYLVRFAAVAALLFASPANADTAYYSYTGGPFTVDIGANPGWGGPNPYFADRPADAATFGTNITGLIAFDFDTTGVTGSICFTFGGCSLSDGTKILTTIQGNLTLKSFTAGIHNLPEFLNPTFVTFTNGAITAWSFGGNVSCPVSLAAIGTCVWETTTERGDQIYGIGLSYYPAFFRGPIGTWVAVPGPIAGAGLPGLILASAGLFAWWRRKKERTIFRFRNKRFG